MLHFECDYACGAADVVMRALIETNSEQHCGYSEDEICDRARKLILDKCNAPDSHVHFVVGGTQANLMVIAAALRPFEGVLCAETGHINVHETGAVEATGHKVLGLHRKATNHDSAFAALFKSAAENTAAEVASIDKE